ncbi:hypothetical protein [Aquimarina litoralis]|uniref:hypothetical protein n=1 Tax=Aquimarina litoralis TaxID=584605 RepID=UPI001C56EF81|nr:hypothetical protein [Aquimarina litoralis]MBW1294535.1 hypothetical protein [Aquimarina litoralis]
MSFWLFIISIVFLAYACYRIVPKLKRTVAFRYQLTFIHPFCVVIILSLIGLYLFSGSGPWDSFLYFVTALFILTVLIIDLFVQYFMYQKNKKLPENPEA